MIEESINGTQDLVWGIYVAQRKSLSHKTNEQLNDLKHRCEELQRFPLDYSQRVAVDMNLAACESLFDERKNASTKKL